MIVGIVSFHVPGESDARSGRRETGVNIERNWAAAGRAGLGRIEVQARSLERIGAPVSGLLNPTRVFVPIRARRSVPVP